MLGNVTERSPTNGRTSGSSHGSLLCAGLSPRSGSEGRSGTAASVSGRVSRRSASVRHALHTVHGLRVGEGHLLGYVQSGCRSRASRCSVSASAKGMSERVMLVLLDPLLNCRIPLRLSVACGDLTVTLQSVNRQGERRSAQLVEQAESLTFSFDNVLPGKYKGKINGI